MIVVKNSDLILLSSTIKSYFVSANGRREGYDPRTLPIAADFQILRQGDRETHTKDLIIISFNVATPDPRDEDFESGLAFTMQIECEFSYPGYDDQNDPALKKEMNNVFLASGVGIMISSCRGYLNHILAHTLYSDYILPTIDLNDLLNQKSALAKQRRKNEDAAKNGTKNKVKKPKEI